MDVSSKLNNEEIDKYMSNLEPEAIVANDPYPILIIDDDIWFQRLLSKHLKSWGFNTYAASDAYKGLALAIKHRPMIIFLDYLMPEITGDMLLKMLKTVEITADIPVIILSGNLSADVISSAYKIGAFAFISKPFSLKLLYEKIQLCLGPSVFNNLKLETSLIQENPAN